MQGPDRHSESDHASVPNNTIPRGKRNPAIIDGPPEGILVSRAVHPHPPVPLGQTGGAGLLSPDDSLESELRELGEVPVPPRLLRDVWLKLVAECSTGAGVTARAEQADKRAQGPVTSGGRSFLSSPSAPAFGRGAGGAE